MFLSSQKTPATPDSGARKPTACKPSWQHPLSPPGARLYLQNFPRLGPMLLAAPSTCGVPFSRDRDGARHDPRHQPGDGHVLGHVTLELHGDHGTPTSSCVRPRAGLPGPPLSMKTPGALADSVSRRYLGTWGSVRKVPCDNEVCRLCRLEPWLESQHCMTDGFTSLSFGFPACRTGLLGRPAPQEAVVRIT